MDRIVLETITAIGGITNSFGLFMAEAAAICFDSQGHSSGVEMRLITGSELQAVVIEWSVPITETMYRTHRDENRATDYGAMALAVLLASQLTHYKEFTVSKKGEGVDFWLADDESLFAARLEISGIRRESRTNTIENRLAIKNRQVKQSDASNTPVFVSISEFNSPKSFFTER